MCKVTPTAQPQGRVQRTGLLASLLVGDTLGPGWHGEGWGHAAVLAAGSCRGTDPTQGLEKWVVMVASEPWPCDPGARGNLGWAPFLRPAASLQRAGWGGALHHASSTLAQLCGPRSPHLCLQSVSWDEPQQHERHLPRVDTAPLRSPRRDGSGWRPCPHVATQT